MPQETLKTLYIYVSLPMNEDATYNSSGNTYSSLGPMETMVLGKMLYISIFTILRNTRTILFVVL